MSEDEIRKLSSAELIKMYEDNTNSRLLTLDLHHRLFIERTLEDEMESRMGGIQTETYPLFMTHLRDIEKTKRLSAWESLEPSRYVPVWCVAGDDGELYGSDMSFFAAREDAESWFDPIMRCKLQPLCGPVPIPLTHRRAA